MEKILITGGTGSLGRALIQLLKEHIVIVYSRDEGKHATIHDSHVIKVIGDIRDTSRINETIEKYKPDSIIHAAALKRIDDMEMFPDECIKTNVMGTKNVALAALNNKIERCILVSTDKACQPINTYGASKFLAEKIFVNMDYHLEHTIFTCVRYGNVIASRGSFIPMWIDRLNGKQRIGITDLSCTRYLFSLQDAAELVINCLRNAIGGEVFVPKLKSYKIFDIYKLVCNKLNKDYNRHYEIIGMRPGEKLHEDMISEHELSRTMITPDKGILAIVPEITNRTYDYELYKGSRFNSAINLYDSNNLTGVLDDYFNFS